ncbi:hypothetical protein CHS0354_023576 [Potamilus streckersoni]|uniref:RING-type domain-containing protein n=1 Tax=Potamilus streckersoni TaxID=2493646 RepID=A0AAE0SZE5_9BIVA|nr:hypothetical protein CHS0354_023576 [Potamilus streckersoni]
MAITNEQCKDEPTCQIYLGDFNIPRQLPCGHTFCQNCLQSYITSEDTKHEKLGHIECTVCRQTATAFKRNEPTSKWASLFHIDTVLQSMFAKKSKVDRVCDACNSEGISVTAKEFCAESCINGLDLQVKGFSNQIQEIRRKINIALDELETLIKKEAIRIRKEQVIKKQEENHHCLSLIHAVRNSRVRMETVREKCMNNETISIELEFSPLIKSVLSLSSSSLGKIVTKTTAQNITMPGLLKATKDCRFEKVDVIDVILPDSTNPSDYDVTFLHGNRVMLADWGQSRCIMVNSSYEFITSYTLTSSSAGLCVVDDQEVAVSLAYHNTIQILSVRDDIISLVRTITTQQTCYGIAASGKREIVVTGDCGNNNYYWSLISIKGDVKSSQQYDSPSGSYNYIAINRAKTRVYVTLPSMHTLLCFDMKGKKHFIYNPSNLKRPLGILVNRDDNIFFTGCDSSNINHLSPDGSLFQVITTEVPKQPFAICMDKRRDMFIVTDLQDKSKIYLYRLK